MALPIDQEAGDGESYCGNIIWTQPAIGLLDPEDDIPISINPDMMQYENELWDLQSNSFNYFNNPAANSTDPSAPRGYVAIEQLGSLFNSPHQEASNNNNDDGGDDDEDDDEFQHFQGNTAAAKEDQEEDPEDVAQRETPHETQRVRRNPGPSPTEWERQMPEIKRLYVDNRYTLNATREVMARRGFHATEGMYKRKVKEWRWNTYGYVNGNSVINRTRGRALDYSGVSHQENSPTNRFRSATTNASHPPHLAHTHFQSNSTASNTIIPNTSHSYFTQFTSMHSNPTLANAIPASMSSPDFDKLMKNLVDNVDNLNISHLSQKKWKIEQERKVEEDIHDDLLVSTASSIRNYSSLSPTVGERGFQKVLCMLGKVVGAREDQDCGLFSLPAIWISFVRLVRKRTDWAKKWAERFLLQAFTLAASRFGVKHSFTQALFLLNEVWIMEPNQIEEAIFTIYGRCIDRVKEEKEKKQPHASNLTYLTLWSDYVVYVDGSSVNKTRRAVDDIRKEIKLWEKRKGPVGGLDGDHTLELLGMTLYVLQSASDMRDEAEKVAKEFLHKINQRKKRLGGKLKGDLLITWKDLKHLLGEFCQEQGKYHEAIRHLEVFISGEFEIEDDRDTLALERLEQCYLALDKEDKEHKANKVWQLRMKASEILLQTADKDHGKRDNDDSKDSSEEEGRSETTIADQAEQNNENNPEEDMKENLEDNMEGVQEVNPEESLDEDDSDENEDGEVEIQLVEEQIAALKKRLNDLKTRRAKKRSGFRGKRQGDMRKCREKIVK